MKIDISRVTFDPNDDFSAVLMQQGRVQLDADWNEQASILDRRIRTESLDILGHSAVPLTTPDGFRLELTAGVLSIQPGRMYVDGLLAENHGGAPEEFDPVLQEERGTLPLTYDAQPYLPAAPGLPADGTHIAYLDVWQRECTYLQHDLIEKAVGVDTTARIQTVWQVKVLELDDPGDIDCTDSVPEWDALTQPSAGRLTSSTATSSAPPDVCTIPPGADYRGAENRLYRVEIHEGGDLATAKFKWSRNNATVASSVDEILSASQVRVATLKRDSYLRFSVGDWVEITDDYLELSGAAGHLAKVVGLFEEDRILTLDPPIPAALNLDASDAGRHTRITRWDEKQSPTGLIEASQGAVELEDGLQVEITLDPNLPNGQCHVGDYWLIAARSVDGSIELLDAEPPRGIHHHYAKLAILKFPDGVDDCRDPWPPWSSQQGCCTYRVGDGVSSHGDFDSIQEAINALPTQGGQVCILPGDYPEHVEIAGRQNVTIVGCGKRTVLRAGADLDADGLPYGDAVVSITGSRYIRVESLAIESPDELPGVRVGEPHSDDSLVERLALNSLSIDAGRRSAIEIHAAREVSVEHCEIHMRAVSTVWPGIFLIAEDGLVCRNAVFADAPVSDPDSDEPAVFGRGGIQLGGTCERVRVIDNLVLGGAGNGITLGSLVLIEQPDSDDPGEIVPAPTDPKDPCDPCAPGSVEIPDDPGEDDGRRLYRSAGPLWEIRIRDNRIYGMGLNGIGVVGFFTPRTLDDLVSVTDLAIVGNEIRYCLAGRLASIVGSISHLMGYGGISLADTADLTIEHNRIEANGAQTDTPVCGIYVLHGEGISISDNSIIDNGRRASADAPTGSRSGIHIAVATAPSEALSAAILESQRPLGAPAAVVHNNTVVHPLGRALYLVGAGPMAITDNRLTSRAVPRSQGLDAGAAVLILNVGQSLEAPSGATNYRSAATGVSNSSVYTARIDDNGFAYRPSAAQQPAVRLANGNVLFADNQVLLDLLDTDSTKLSSSIAILTADDLCFADNQCDCLLAKDYLQFHAFLWSRTLRVENNRFKERLGQAGYSALALSNVLNTTTGNQSTHCLVVKSFTPNMVIDNNNLVFAEVSTPGFCKRASELIRQHSRILRSKE
jgi:hypothetical protein